MDILGVYKELSSLHVVGDDVQEFAKGYRVYCALDSLGWIQTPLRLVYHKPQSATMVVLPFYVPELRELLWGVEIKGIYLALQSREEKESYAGSIIAKAYGDSSFFWGDFMMAKERPLELPSTQEFHLLHQQSAIAKSCFDILGRRGLSVAGIESEMYVKTAPCTLQQIAEYRAFETKPATVSTLRYVLHANNNLDLFCKANRFGVPNKGALKKCLLALDYELPEAISKLL